MKKLLIVEDDLWFCKILDKILSKYYELAFCPSGEDFFARHTSVKYDLIILDISLMGRIDGFQISRDVRKNYLFPEIPIICLTAHAYHKDRRTAIASGINVFLTKPVDNKVLLNEIKYLLDISKAD